MDRMSAKGMRATGIQRAISKIAQWHLVQLTTTGRTSPLTTTPFDATDFVTATSSCSASPQRRVPIVGLPRSVGNGFVNGNHTLRLLAQTVSI